MPTVAVIDDRSEPRTTLARMLEMSLESLSEEWMTIDSAPLKELQAYPSWIAENDIVAIVLDERLQEQAWDAEGHVDYNGHQLVDFLRDRLLYLPLYMVTAFSEDSDLSQRSGQVEGIIDKRDFTDNLATYAERIARSGLRFLAESQKRLAEMAEKSTSVAMGHASKEDIDRLRALQEALRIPLATEALVDSSRWIDDFEEQVKKLEELKTEIEVYLNENREEE